MPDIKITIRTCPEHEEDKQYTLVFYMGDKCPYCELLNKYRRLEDRVRDDTGQGNK